MLNTIRRDLDAVLLFARVAQLGTFTAAAKALQLPKATVSTRISDLEASLGQQLLERSTRRVRVTEAGRLFLASCERILDELEQARHALEGLSDGPRGILRMSAPFALSRSVLAPLMPAFCERFPALSLRLDVNNRALDLLGEENELALYIGAPPPYAGEIVEITRFRTRLVGSRDYLERRGRPHHPSELSSHELLSVTDREGRLTWSLRRGETVADVQAHPRLSTIDPDTRATLVRHGMGLSWLPDFLCGDGLRSGELEVVLPGWEHGSVRLQGLLPMSQARNPKARAMLGFLQEAIGPTA